MPEPGDTGPAGVVSVTPLVVAYRKPAALERLLSSLPSGACVVNVTADPEVARVARRHGAGVVDLPANGGFAAAVNAGVAAIASDAVIVLNDDVVMLPGAVDVLTAALRAGADVVGPRLVDAEGSLEPSVLGLPTVGQTWLTLALPDRPVRGLRWLPVAKWQSPRQAGPVPALSAAALAVRTEVLRRHPMPEAYFLYWEETEWFWHLSRAGRRVEMHPMAVVAHLGGRRDVRPEKAALLSRNAVRCLRRTQGRTAAALVWPVVVLAGARLWLSEGLRLVLHSGNRERLAARSAGLRASVRALGELR